jgi:hypothetical protein
VVETQIPNQGIDDVKRVFFRDRLYPSSSPTVLPLMAMKMVMLSTQKLVASAGQLFSV